MELKTINDAYLDLKKRLEAKNKIITKAKEDIKKIETEKKTKLSDKKIVEGELEKAKRNKDEAEIKNKTKEIDDINADIRGLDEKTKQIKEEMEVHQSILDKLQEQINDKLKELQENPEMKKYIEEIIAKKYERKLKLEKKEIEVVAKKREKFEKLQKLVEKSPTVKNYLIGIMNSKIEIDKLKKEIDKLEKVNPIDNRKIADIKTKISRLEVKITKNKDLLMGIKELDFKDEDLKELLDNGIIVNKNGKIDLETTLNKRKAQLDRQIKGYTKSIANHEKALETLGRGTSQQTPSNSAQTPSQTVSGQAPNQPTSGQAQGQSGDNEQEEKPKWYQFMRRLKNWNEKRKQKALSDPNQQPQKNNTPNQTIDNFRNAYKYDIVKDLCTELEKKTIKDSKKKVKEDKSFETPISQDQDKER